MSDIKWHTPLSDTTQMSDKDNIHICVSDTTQTSDTDLVAHLLMSYITQMSWREWYMLWTQSGTHGPCRYYILRYMADRCAWFETMSGTGPYVTQMSDQECHMSDTEWRIYAPVRYFVDARWGICFGCKAQNTIRLLSDADFSHWEAHVRHIPTVRHTCSCHISSRW